MSSTDAQIPGYVRFIIAGLAGGAASFASHPFDLVKYRMQMSGKGASDTAKVTMFRMMYKINKQEGYRALYDGLSASIIRQLTLTTTRVGLYSVIVDKLTATDGTPPSIFLQLAAGMVSGFAGAVVGNPADVALVRMSLDRGYPPEERYNYKSTYDACKRIVKEEGLGALWTGWKPAALRCIILNITQLVLYKNTKTVMLRTEWFSDTTELHVICSVWTALISSVATSPIDVAKTRIMAMKNVDGELEYKGMKDVCIKMIRKEGFLSLWKGVTPNFARILPNNFVIFFTLEILTRTYKRIILKDKSGTGF